MRIYAAAPQLVEFDDEPAFSPPVNRAPFSYREVEADLRSALLRARHAVLAEQTPSGAWQGEQELDPGFSAKQLLLDHCQGQPSNETECEQLLEAQLPTGGWERLPGHGAELNTTLLVYAALRVAGHGAHLPAIRRAFQAIRRLGGVAAASNATRGWLRLTGIMDADYSPLDAPTELLGSGVELDWPELSPAQSTLAVPSSPLLDTALALRALLASGLPTAANECQRGFTELVRQLSEAPAASVLELATAILAGEQLLAPPCPIDCLPPALSVHSSDRKLSRTDPAPNISEDSLAKHRQSLADLAQSLPNSQFAADIAGYLLPALAKSKFSLNTLVDSLRGAQQADGSWPAEWLLDRVGGTAHALVGLAAAGAAEDDPAVLRGVNWLFAHQQPSGGWGEPEFMDHSPSRCETAAATASQTAWALGGLIAAGYANHPAAADAVRFLLETQEEDGSWNEPHFTLQLAGAAHAGRNSLYATAFATTALAQWAQALSASVETTTPTLRVVRC